MDRTVTFRTAVLLFVLLYADICIMEVNALRCYDCYSITTTYCNDPFMKNSTKSRDFPAGNVCAKLKGDMKNGDGFVVRREGMKEADFDELVRSNTFPDVTMEKCKTDLCNSAGVSGPTFVAVAIAAAATVNLH